MHRLKKNKFKKVSILADVFPCYCLDIQQCGLVGFQMDKCVQHTKIMLNAFNSIQLLLQPLDMEFSAVSSITSMEAWLLCQAQVERFA